MPTRCFCPPDSCSTWVCALSASPTNVSSSTIRSCRSARGTPATTSGYSTLPYTVRDVNRLNCWKIMPMPRRTCCSLRSDSPTISVPSTRMEPDVAGSSALTRRTRVDFPAPE